MENVNKIGALESEKELWVKLKSEEQRKEVIRRKSNLKGKRKKIYCELILRDLQ